MGQIMSTLLGLHGPTVYVVITVLVLLEAAAFVGLVVPGETALLVGGVLAARGNLSLPVLLPLVALAAVVGDSVGYAIGRQLGPALESSRAGGWIGAERWSRAHAYVETRGAAAVVLGRWVGLMRALVPTVAGATGMPYRRFLVANVAGGLTWVAVVTGLGYLAAGSLSTVQSLLGRLSLFGTAILVVLVAAAALAARRRRVVRTEDARPRSNRWWVPAMVFAGATLAAVELLDSVRERADLAAYDPLVASETVAQREPALTVMAHGVTLLGSAASLGTLTVVVLAWLGWRRRWRVTALFAAAMASSVALTVVLKDLVGRARPPAWMVLGPLDSGAAFPSGHTLNATVFFGLIAALAVGRIYLGCHWMTDVMADWSIGLVLLALTALGWLALVMRPPPSSIVTAEGV